MPATQICKHGSLNEETPGQSSHSLGPGSSTNLERSQGSSPQGAHFSFALTGCLVTTREVGGGGGRQDRQKDTIKQQEDQALWLKIGPAQVLPLPRQGLVAKMPHLPASSRPPLNLLPCTAWIFPYIPRQIPLSSWCSKQRGLKKLR